MMSTPKKKTARARPQPKAKTSASSARRIGGENSETRALILDATEAVMIRDGYAAATTRRVAAEAGIKPALVQYYFRTMDDLLLAVYRRAAGAVAERQAEALSSDRPLHALWALNAEPERTALAIEFMALANHRKVIKAEITRYNGRARQDQVEALQSLLRGRLKYPARYPPEVISALLVFIARGLIMEEGMGVKTGHEQTRALVAWWLKQIERPAKASAKKRNSADRS